MRVCICVRALSFPKVVFQAVWEVLSEWTSGPGERLDLSHTPCPFSHCPPACTPIYVFVFQSVDCGIRPLIDSDVSSCLACLSILIYFCPALCLVRPAAWALVASGVSRPSAFGLGVGCALPCGCCSSLGLASGSNVGSVGRFWLKFRYSV